jgi:hypothetical protein
MADFIVHNLFGKVKFGLPAWSNAGMMNNRPGAANPSSCDSARAVTRLLRRYPGEIFDNKRKAVLLSGTAFLVIKE